jgi:hypothetical protein
MRTLIASLILFFAPLCFATNYHPQVQSALKYLEAVQAPSEGDYVIGEWPTEVKSILLPGLIGAGRWGKAYPEATNFTTATIVEVLGGMYQEDPSLKEIPAMTKKAVAGFKSYVQGPLFNFYPPREHKGVPVRGPRSMYLAPFIKGLANVPSDSDSTSTAYVAMNYYELQKSGRRDQKFLKEVSPEVYENFSRFRDVDRKPHHFNRSYGYRDTGAFLTWLMDENDPDRPAKFAPPQGGHRIPFGTNDVDCVVNTNVMKLLTWAGKTQIPGYQETCNYLKQTIDQEGYGNCGIYYPNSYSEILGLSQLHGLNTSCLDSHYPKVLNYILDTQDWDGGWTNPPPGRPDRVQSTALALNALMELGDRNNPEHREKVRKGIQYLLSKAQRDPHGNLYWEGQVYFSAVSQARFTVSWRSSAYTTALGAKALLMAERF